MHRPVPWLRAALMMLLLICLPPNVLLGQSANEGLTAQTRWTRTWRDDRIWHDGLAELAVYEATRSIYGKTRHYTARIYTNKELLDPRTQTKSASSQGIPVFKHHVRDDIETENYTYHYSTMSYTHVDTLQSIKLDMGSQEDCGASFKQFFNLHSRCNWKQFSYFPNEGAKRGTFNTRSNFVFQNALSLVLRSYPFDKPLKPLAFQTLFNQTHARLSAHMPASLQVTYIGPETLNLPMGQVQAHRLAVAVGPSALPGRPEAKTKIHAYWFAASAKAPWLNVMVQYRGPGEQTYRLKAHRRWAYWKRPAG